MLDLLHLVVKCLKHLHDLLDRLLDRQELVVRSEHTRQADFACALLRGLVQVLNLVKWVARAWIQYHGRVLDQRVGAETFETPDPVPRMVYQGMCLVYFLVCIVACFEEGHGLRESHLWVRFVLSHRII